MHVIFWGHYFWGGIIFFCGKIILGKIYFWGKEGGFGRKGDLEGRKEDLERRLKANLGDLLSLL